MPSWSSIILFFAIAICLVLLDVRLDRLERPQPVEAVATVEVPPGVLVGTGCVDPITGATEGPSSIAVAWEESELPVCKQIDRHLIR